MKGLYILNDILLTSNGKVLVYWWGNSFGLREFGIIEYLGTEM